jgi:hypothetical protein
VSPGDVAAAEKHVRLHTVSQNENLLLRDIERLQQFQEALRLRYVIREVVDHEDRVLAGTRVERALSR